MNSKKIAENVFKSIKDNKNGLSKVSKNYKEFTNLLKLIIGDLGVFLGYEVATECSKKKYNEGEWLFDLVWYNMKDEPNSNIITSIDLVFETEISKKDFEGFKVDYDKLLIATNSTKMILFSKVSDKLLNKILDYIQESLNSFKDLVIGSNVYLILWDENITGNFNMVTITKK